MHIFCENIFVFILYFTFQTIKLAIKYSNGFIYRTTIYIDKSTWLKSTKYNLIFFYVYHIILFCGIPHSLLYYFNCFHRIRSLMHIF